MSFDVKVFKSKNLFKKPKNIFRVPRKPPAPPLLDIQPISPQRADDQHNALVRALGGDSSAEKLAKTVETLRVDHPHATVPELVTYNWLEAHGVPFKFQAALLGGRTVRGGALPDFVLQLSRQGGMVWNVNGTYWHNIPLVAQREQVQRESLLGQTLDGILIQSYVALWEDRIMARNRDELFWSAMSGVEMPRR